MKPKSFRHINRRKSKSDISTARVIAAFILIGILVWILYKGKIENFFNTYFSKGSQKTEKTFQLNGIPKLEIYADGIKYIAQAVDPVAQTELEVGTIPLAMGMGKNSRLELSFEKEPDSFNVIIYRDDINVLSGQLQEIFSSNLPGDGEYIGVCEANYNSGLGFIGNAFYKFRINADFPPSISISATETDPGELIVVYTENLNPEEKLEIETDLDYKPNVFNYGHKNIIMLPISYHNEPGKVYQLKVTMGDETVSYAIRLNEKEFITQHLKIDAKIAAETRNDKSAREVEEKVDPLRPVSDNEPYWSGKFIMPVDGGRVNEADFGKHRFVNDSKTSYRHNGLDIGHDIGIPVMASNNGRVLLAEYLIGTGFTVIIEHGFGLKTWYYHMNELTVETGDWVMKGDVIGKVGSTGFSTSPHLHFSASVNEVYINPITLIAEGVPLLALD